MTEKQEQTALITRAYYHPITKDYLWASANGGSRHPWEGRSLKLQGVKAGIPDLFLAYPSGEFHGLFIELKRLKPKRGILTAEQIIMLNRLKKVGYAVHVAYGWEDAWKIIKSYLAISEIN